MWTYHAGWRVLPRGATWAAEELQYAAPAASHICTSTTPHVGVERLQSWGCACLKRGCVSLTVLSLKTNHYTFNRQELCL
jgi:hypothetical protein